MNGYTAAERISGEIRLANADWIVTDDAAHGIVAARTGARVSAALVDAGQIRRTVRVDDALGPAVGRVADHAGLAAALGVAAHHLALRVGSARRRHARIGRLGHHRLRQNGHRRAPGERVARVAYGAAADGIVVGDAADGVVAAHSGARIATPLRDARRGLRAIGVGHALGTAAGRHTEERRLARTGRHAVDVAAHAVGTAGRRRAAVGHHRFDGSRLDGRRSTGRRRFASVAVQAAADGDVVDDAALGVQSAHARTGIDAAVVDAALVPGTVGILDAFRPAAGVRVVSVADVVGRAGAGGAVALRAALRSRAAGRRRARAGR